MARSKYCGITVAKEIKEGVLVSMRIDKKFVVSKKTSGKKSVLHVFNPGDILDVGERTLEKNFKKYLANYTDKKINITPEVKVYLSNMQARLKNNAKESRHLLDFNQVSDFFSLKYNI